MGQLQAMGEKGSRPAEANGHLETCRLRDCTFISGPAKLGANRSRQANLPPLGASFGRTEVDG